MFKKPVEKVNMTKASAILAGYRRQTGFVINVLESYSR
jgi:hypothetical protein